MLPQPMSFSERKAIESDPLSQPDLVLALEQELAAGFPPGLALDLVLNELVVRASAATHARAAAVALKRGDEMVCRAATGQHAPDLGIPLNTSDGVSGACLRTRESQLCLDTESDPRVDASTCRRQGIRSMLVVPVLDEDELVGVLEVFSDQPAEFVESDQNLLEIFACECNRIRSAAVGFDRSSTLPSAAALLPISPLRYLARRSRAPYEGWTVILGGLAIVLIIAFSFVIGARIGWLGIKPKPASPAPPAPTAISTPAPVRADEPKTAQSTHKPAVQADANGLVVYDQGKVIFRMRPAARNASAKPTSRSDTATPAELARVWLASDLAESLLVHRVEPQYPAEALAAHRSGDVVLEVLVNRDGTVASMRPVHGDTLLATAAEDAVRNWRYEPYRVKGQPAEFQTDVTLKFSLPD